MTKYYAYLITWTAQNGKKVYLSSTNAFESSPNIEDASRLTRKSACERIKKLQFGKPCIEKHKLDLNPHIEATIYEEE